MKIKERIWIEVKPEQKAIKCPVCGHEIERDGHRPKHVCRHVVDWSLWGKYQWMGFEKEVEAFYPRWFAKKFESVTFPPTPERIALELEEISFHQSWGDVWNYLFPGFLMGWGNHYDGGQITYRGMDYYFDTDAIREGAIRQMRENCKWSKKDWVRFWKENQEDITLQGASGRVFQLTHSK